LTQILCHSSKIFTILASLTVIVNIGNHMKLIRALTLAILALLISSHALEAQRNYTVEADQRFSLDQFNEAIDLYKKAFSKVKKNRAEKNRIQFQIAECYRFIGNTKNAESAYKRCIKSKYQQTEPRIFLYLAEAQRANGIYEEAITSYQDYLKLVPGDQKALNGIESCKVMKQWMDNPTRYEVNNMKKFNTRDNEWSPAFTDKKKANIIVFTSTREGSAGKGADAWTGTSFSDFYFVNEDRRGSFSSPEPFDLEFILNSEANEGEACFNEKGNVIYFTRCDKQKKEILGCRIYRSEQKGKSWDEPEAIDLGLDSFYYVHPAISSDELTLYFSSNMPGGYGEYDLWCAKRDKKNKPFGRPVNLGPNVNTPGKEMFPTVRYDTTLYFSSDGLVGLGGFDIYKTVYLNDEWQTPVNMLSPVNSTGDDIGMAFYPNEERGFLSSNRTGGRGGDDIYSFYLPPLLYTLAGVVRDDNTLQLLEGAAVKIQGSDGSSYEAKTNRKGFYKFDNTQIKLNVTYNMTVEKKGYFSEKGSESTVGLTANKDLIHNFRLVPIPPDPIPLPEIRYELARWELQPQYQDSLMGLISTLDTNPHLVIELQSHTDSRRIPMTNDTLSQRRAQSVVDYLIIRGIHPGRLVAKGYGANVPRTLKTDLSSEYKGKLYTFKAGVTLTDDYIKTLKSTDEKEAAHQLNRRTEFRILRDDFIPPPSIDSTAGVVQIIKDQKAENTVAIAFTAAGNPEVPCIANGVQTKFVLDDKAKTGLFNYETAMKWLKDGRITKADFKEKEKSIDEDGNIVDKAVLILRDVEIGNKKITNIEVTLSKTTKNQITLNKALLSGLGEYTINKEKKQLELK